MEHEVVEAINSLNTNFEDFKKQNDIRIAEIETKGAADCVTEDNVRKLNETISQLAKTVEEIQIKANRPGSFSASDEPDPLATEKAAHKSAFVDFIRAPAGEQKMAESALQSAAMALRAKGKELDIKQVDTLTGAAGGYGVPEDLSSDIEKTLTEISPMRQDCKVETRGADPKRLVNRGGIAGGWVGEGDARTETGTSTLQEVSPTIGTPYGLPQTTEESLQDVYFDVEAWLREDGSEELAELEGIAFVSGDGVKKPTGFLDGTPVVTGDAGRAEAVLQFFASGAAATFAASNPSDALLSLVYGLKKTFRKGALWRMNGLTQETIRKFKDADGNYIWQPAMTEDQPSRLMGYGISEDEAMPDIAANAFPVAFANWNRGYWIVDRAGMAITRDEITEPGFVKFYMRRRVGGKVLNDKAIKLLKIAA